MITQLQLINIIIIIIIIIIRTGSSAHSASYLVCNSSSFLEGQSCCGMNVSTHHHLVLRVKSGWSNTFTHPTCPLGADGEKFPFTFTFQATSNFNNQGTSGIFQLRYKTTTLDTFCTDSTFNRNKSQRTNAVPSVRALKQGGPE